MRTRVTKTALTLSNLPILENNTKKQISESNLLWKKGLSPVVINGFRLCWVHWDLTVHKPYWVRPEILLYLQIYYSFVSFYMFICNTSKSWHNNPPQIPVLSTFQELKTGKKKSVHSTGNKEVWFPHTLIVHTWLTSLQCWDLQLEIFLQGGH